VVDDQTRIRPWTENAHYWQFKGEPILLLGGSREDNLFQISDLESHLDTLSESGGNYVRNTMSDRDPGDARPFARSPDGRYDLDRWNPEYWDRFDLFLELTAERDIIVQIEIWDRFDHSNAFWESDPYNPANNINYDFEAAGFAPQYPEHPGKNQQPFFKTPPSMDNNTVVLPYQLAFMHQILRHTLPHGHILYCIDNEFGGLPEWSNYWAELVHTQARNANTAVEVTEMFDGNLEMLAYVIDHPDHYSFVEANKIMAPQKWAAHGEEQWHRTKEVIERMGSVPCPLTIDKMRGTSNNITGDHVSISFGKFWRGLLAGYSAIRFHRPVPGSLGLDKNAQNCIRAARELEQRVRIWDLEPRLDLIVDRHEDSAYLLTGPDGTVVLYFPDGGRVRLDPSVLGDRRTVRWLNIREGVWAMQDATGDGPVDTVSAPDAGHWVAVITNE